MQFEGAVVKEQGVTFAIVVVKRHILNSRYAAQQTADAFAVAFPGLPLILMGQDARGVATYYGRKDIVNFLARVPVNAIPWQRYTWN